MPGCERLTDQAMLPEIVPARRDSYSFAETLRSHLPSFALPYIIRHPIRTTVQTAQILALIGGAMAIAPEAGAQVVSTGSNPNTASADTKTYAANAILTSANCNFALGFKVIHDQIPDKVGNCVDNEQHNPENGDGLQHTQPSNTDGPTSIGLLVWRKVDNWTAFTDGFRSWVNGPNGLQLRLNSQRFSWEANPDDLPLADPNNPIKAAVGGGSIQPAESTTPAPTPSLETISPNQFIPNINRQIIINVGSGISGQDQDIVRQGANIAKSFYASLGFSLPSIIAINIDSGRPYNQSDSGVESFTIHTGSAGWISRSRSAKMQTAAHEEFHNAQFATAAGINTPIPNWILEGSAEFMGYSAIASSGLTSLTDGRSCSVARLKTVGFRSLDQVEKSWYSAGSYPEYSLAYLAVDLLTSLSSDRALRDYFVYLGGVNSSVAFQKAFGKDAASFTSQVDSWVAGQQGDQSACQRAAI